MLSWKPTARHLKVNLNVEEQLDLSLFKNMQIRKELVSHPFSSVAVESQLIKMPFTSQRWHWWGNIFYSYADDKRNCLVSVRFNCHQWTSLNNEYDSMATVIGLKQGSGISASLNACDPSRVWGIHLTMKIVEIVEKLMCDISPL